MVTKTTLCEAQQVWWDGYWVVEGGTGHVGLHKYVGGWYWACEAQQVGGGWILGMWDWWRVGTGHVGLCEYVGGWAPGMYCFFRRWDDI